jgi:two-component system, response regulator RegA
VANSTAQMSPGGARTDGNPPSDGDGGEEGHPEAESGEGPHTSPFRTILFVDDCEQIRGALVRDLMRRGYFVLQAGSYRRGMQQAEMLRPERAVVDLGLPEEEIEDSGRHEPPRAHGLRLIRDLAGLVPEMRVLAISAYASIDTVRKALRHGAIDFLPKPVSADDILAAFKEADRPPELSENDLELKALTLNEAKLLQVELALAQAEGNMTNAARILGVSRNTLYYMLRPKAEDDP